MTGMFAAMCLILLARLLLVAAGHAFALFFKIVKTGKMIRQLFRKKVRDLNAMFNGHYIDVKAFYAWQFNSLPCVQFIGELDTSKAFNHISAIHAVSIVNIYQHSWYNHAEQTMQFNNTIFVLSHDRMIELANDYCMILFAPHQYAWARQMINEMSDFRMVPQGTVRVMGFAREPAAN